MSIRKQALENNAFAQLKYAYDNRKQAASAWKAQGKKVVGVLGFDVPDELLMAADMMPYQIHGNPEGVVDETDKYLEFSFPPVIKSQFEKVIRGEDADIADYLVIANSTDAILRIYYYIREVKALEPEKKIPEIYFIDWVFTRFRMHQIRNETVIGEFRKQLEKWSGKEITDEAITAAAEICNKNRRLLGKVSELRRQGKINGAEALVIIGAAYYMEKEAHSRLLEELIEVAASWNVCDGEKVFVTGSVQEYTDFYELLEENGMYAVSEDHDYGDRYHNRQMNTEIAPIKGIVDRYMLRSAGTKRAFVSERVDAVCSAVRECGAKGVISYTHRYDDAPSWDFPEQKKALTEMNVKSLQLSNQNYKLVKDVRLADTLKAFAQQIKEG